MAHLGEARFFRPYNDARFQSRPPIKEQLGIAIGYTGAELQDAINSDPAALARDLAYFAEGGYRLEALRALDLFPMTHHVECVALLVPEAEVG